MEENNNIDKTRALDKPRQHPLTSPQPLYYPPDPEEEVHLRDYLYVLLRRKWIIITFLLVIVTTVTIGTFLKKPTYKSMITMKIEREKPNFVVSEGVVGVDMSEENYFQTQCKVLKSRNLAKRVIRSLGLNTNPEFARDPKNKKTESDNSNFLDDNTLSEEEIDQSLINTFIDRVDVNPVQRSSLVNVSFISYSPELAAKVANSIGESFIDLNIESRFEATHKAREWLQGQIDVMKAKLEQAEEKLNEYASKHGIIFLEENEKGVEGENIITKRLSELSTSLTSATAERMNREAIYNTVRSGDHESSTVVMSDPLIVELKKTLATLESEYNQNLKTYKPEYPKMVRLNKQINHIKKKMDSETKKIVTSVKKDYETALKREKYLRSELEAQKKEALNLKDLSVQYQILKREVDTNRELYNGLLQRLKETGVSETLRESNVQVIDRAEVPKSPYKPNKRLNILLSIIVGLFGGIGLAFFVEYLDNTIKTPEDVEKRAFLPSLGFIPSYTAKEENLPVEYITHTDSKSPISEAYRTLRTLILLSTGGRPPRVIAITSPESEEGKTTTAINTAISLAKSNTKVIIIDADMRKPRLHKIFDIENTTGISTYLSGIEEFREDSIKETDIQNLHIITSGPTPPNPAELLSSHRLRELINSLYLYNFIIFDTSPVIGLPDTLILSSQTDGVILVAKSGKTTKEATLEARKMLEAVNVKILGVVLNSVDQSIVRYKHYYNYYRHYYGGEENK
ncbi:MAG: polysaccharide biosynthesis tyrosine autokinase [Nitrospirota bacterium]